MNEIERMLRVLCLDEHPLSKTLRELAVCKEIPKQTKIVSPEAEEPYVIFLVSGLLRGYLVDERGGEITDCFAFHYGDCRISFLPAEKGQVKEYVETLEDTMIVSIELKRLMPFLFQEPTLISIWMNCMANIYSEQILHKRILCHTTAMERYKWFLENYPGIIDRAPHRHIASFLNITPVTLSRLRREVQRSENM